jgi:hypothetical protein
MTGSVCYSIENDESYSGNSKLMLPLVENTELNVNGHTYDNCVLYKGLERFLSVRRKFDFVFVDGPNDVIPFNYRGLKYSRVQLLDFVLMDKLSDRSIVMYHDSEREESKATLEEFELQLKHKGFDFEKEVVIEEKDDVVEYNKRVLGTCPELTIYKIWR